MGLTRGNVRFLISSVRSVASSDWSDHSVMGEKFTHKLFPFHFYKKNINYGECILQNIMYPLREKKNIGTEFPVKKLFREKVNNKLISSIGDVLTNCLAKIPYILYSY